MKNKLGLLLGFLSLLLGVIGYGLLSRSADLFTSDSNAAAVLPAVLIDLSNREREKVDQEELVVSPLLTEAAQLKANDMATRGYFSHDTPEGLKPWHWLGIVKYDYLHAGENVAVNFSSSKKVVSAWMNSPAHRSNILKGNYTEIGMATAKGMYKGKRSVFVVQFFGTPKSSSTAVRPVPSMSSEEAISPPRVSFAPASVILLLAEELFSNGEIPQVSRAENSISRQ